jgi:hypothetical protein
MTTDTTISKVEYPSYISDRQQQLLNELFGTSGSPGGVIGSKLDVPGKEVIGLQQPTLDAIQMARQGIGAYEPFLQGAGASQQSALATTRAGQEALANMQFDPNAIKQYMDPYQQDVTNEALKEIDRQAAMQENQLAGKAAQAGAFGGSRFGLQQSEMARNAQDLRSRRIFEDMSRNYQQAQAAMNAANQQRVQQASGFGQLGNIQSGIGQRFGQLGQQAQSGLQQDISMLTGVGGLMQQNKQLEKDTSYANELARLQEPFNRISFGSNILAQISPFGGQQTQTISPLAQNNPFATALGAAGQAYGLGSLIKQ